MNKRLITWSILSIILVFLYPFTLFCFIVVFSTYKMNNPGIFVIGYYIWSSFWGYIINLVLCYFLKISRSNEKRFPILFSWLIGLVTSYLLEYYVLGDTDYHTRVTMSDNNMFYISPIVGIFVCLISYFVLDKFFCSKKVYQSL